MTQRPEETAGSRTDETAGGRADEHRRDGAGLSPRGWTIALSFLLVVVFVLAGGLVQVPYVAEGPGPTFNTLGRHEGSKVVTIAGGPKVHPTTGQLRMTTVSVTDQLSLFGAMALWVSGRNALAPRELFFPPGKTQKQVDRSNRQQFTDSQSNAEVAALRYLHYPVKVLANSIFDGTPVDGKIQAGDRIRAVDGTRVNTARQVIETMRRTRPGQVIPVVVQSAGGPKRTERIRLGMRPKGPDGKRHGDYGYLGLTPVDRADVNFDVRFKLSDVGGPSAGMIFALTIVDKLTDGRLTGGKNIAGTGEITPEGQVQRIGGINFKLVAAKEQGASTFLVPAANCAEAKASAPDGLELVKVNRLRDAVADLRALRSGRGDVPHC